MKATDRLQSQSQSHVPTDGQSASLPWYRVPIFAPRPEFCYYQTFAGMLIWGTLSNERKGLSFTTAVSAVILGSESLGTHDRILLSQTETPGTWRARSPYFHPQGTGWLSYTPRNWVPFSSPPTTRGVTMEAFEPASTRATRDRLVPLVLVI
jgi:hypothetical protein